MTRKSKSAKSTFAEQYAELEKIVADFEREGMSVDEGLGKFERGLQIAKNLRTMLSGFEHNIEKLKKQYKTDESEEPTRDE